MLLNILAYLFQKRYNSKDIFLLAFFFLCANLAFNLFNEYFLGLGYPYSTFLFRPEDRYADFFKVIDMYQIVDTWDRPNDYGNMFSPYAMPVSSIYYSFFGWLILLVKSKYFVYIALNAGLLGSYLALSRKLGNSYFITILSCLTYPVVFAIDRGNFAPLIFVLILYALTTNKAVLSSLALAFATCLRITPVVFIVAVLLKNKLRPGQIILRLAMLIIFIASMVYGSIELVQKYISTEAFDPSQFGLLANQYNDLYLYKLGGLAYGSSLFMPSLYLAMRYNMVDFITYVKPIYLPVAFFGIIGILLLIKNSVKQILMKYLTYEKVIYVLAITFVLFMPVTADYYLMLLFIPLIIFPKKNYSFGYFLLYGSILGAKNFIYVNGSDISWQVFLNPILLLILLFAEFGFIPFINKDTPVIERGATGSGVSQLDILVFIQNARSRIGNVTHRLASLLSKFRRLIIGLASVTILIFSLVYGMRVVRDELRQRPVTIEKPSPDARGLKFGMYASGDLDDKIIIECWAFPETGNCNSCIPYITLGSPTKTYAARAIRSLRPDVVSFFKDSTVLNSGLAVSVRKDFLPKGSYRIGILFKDSLNHLDYYSATNILVHVNLPDVAIPEELTPSTVSKDTIRAFIDKIEENKSLIEVHGWAFMNGVTTDSTKTSMVLKSENKWYRIDVAPSLRPDIQSYFNLSYNVDLAGFSLKFSREDVEPGEYELCVMMTNKKSGRETIQSLGETIVVARRDYE